MVKTFSGDRTFIYEFRSLDVVTDFAGVVVFPNPSSGYFNSLMLRLTLQLLPVTLNELQTIDATTVLYNTEAINLGIYFFRLRSQEELLGQGKVEIIR